MKYNQLGTSELRVSELCLGTMTFGEQNTLADAKEQLDLAFERGVNFVDAAEMYPVPTRAETQGRTESFVGEWLSGRNRDSVIVATKIVGQGRPFAWLRNGSHAVNRSNVRRALEDSLRRLKTDYVDLYQIHWPDRYVPIFGHSSYDPQHERTATPIAEQLSAFAELIREGKLRYVGLSNETAWGVSEFSHVAKAQDLPHVASIQNAYNLLNRTFDTALAEASHRERVGLLAYSPLAFGFLTGKYLDGVPKESRLGLFDNFGQRYRKPNVAEATRAYAQLARESGLSPAHLALAFVRSRWFVASTIIGATKREQLEENLGSLDVTLSADVLAKLDAIHARFPEPSALTTSPSLGTTDFVAEPTSLWEVPAFRHYLAGIVLVTLANQMQGTVVAYQVYELTRDPLSLGTVGLAEALPFIALALLGGHVADARDRRTISLVVLTFASLLSLALLGFTLLHGALGAVRHKWAIYSVIALLGVCRSFLQPARAALNAEVLPPSLYAKAIAVRTSLFQLAMVSGPAVGGLLYAAAGPQVAYGAAAALLVLAWFETARIPRVRLTAPKTDKAFGHSVLEGFRYLAADRLLLPAIQLDLFAVLFGGATALLPVFANEILHVGSQGFGALRAAPAVGALTASLILARRAPLERAGKTMLLAVCGFGVATIAFALSRSFLVSLALLAIVGACDMVSVVVRSTLLQLRVPGYLLGRIASINQIFIGSSNEIGAFESGVAARLLGAVPAVVVGGSMTLLVAAVTAIRAPELRRLGSLAQWTMKSPTAR